MVLSLIGSSGGRSTPVTEIKGISSLDTAREEDLSFLGIQIQVSGSLTSASVVLLPEDYDGQPKEINCLSGSKNPRRAWPKLSFLEKRISPAPSPGIHETAFVHPEAKIAEGVFIGAFFLCRNHVSIGANSVIGSHCHLGIMLESGSLAGLIRGQDPVRCLIGDRVILNGWSLGRRGRFGVLDITMRKYLIWVLSLLRKTSSEQYLH